MPPTVGADDTEAKGLTGAAYCVLVVLASVAAALSRLEDTQDGKQSPPEQHPEERGPRTLRPSCREYRAGHRLREDEGGTRTSQHLTHVLRRRRSSQACILLILNELSFRRATHMSATWRHTPVDIWHNGLRRLSTMPRTCNAGVTIGANDLFIPGHARARWLTLVTNYPLSSNASRICRPRTGRNL